MDRKDSSDFKLYMDVIRDQRCLLYENLNFVQGQPSFLNSYYIFSLNNFLELVPLSQILSHMNNDQNVVDRKYYNNGYFFECDIILSISISCFIDCKKNHRVLKVVMAMFFFFS